MHVEHNQDGIIGMCVTAVFGAITFIDVELSTKILASIATTVAAGVTIYFQFKNNRKKK